MVNNDKEHIAKCILSRELELDLQQITAPKRVNDGGPQTDSSLPNDENEYRLNQNDPFLQREMSTKSSFESTLLDFNALDDTLNREMRNKKNIGIHYLFESGLSVDDTHSI